MVVFVNANNVSVTLDAAEVAATQLGISDCGAAHGARITGQGIQLRNPTGEVDFRGLNM